MVTLKTRHEPISPHESAVFLYFFRSFKTSNPFLNCLRCVFFVDWNHNTNFFPWLVCKNSVLNWHEPHQCFFNHLNLSSIQAKNGSQRKKWQHFRMKNEFFRFLSSFQCEYNFQFNRFLCEYNFQYNRFVCLGGYIPSENWKTTSFLSSFYQKLDESRKNLKVF